MRWQWLLLALPLLAMAPLRNDYGKKEDVFTEMRNIFDNGQDKSYTVVTSSPNFQDMRDGEMFVFVTTPTTANIRLMLRVGNTVYASPEFSILKGR